MLAKSRADGEPDFSTLSGRLRWAMDSAQKTNQSVLAREIGIRPQAIQYLIEPKNNATGSKHIAALAGALGVSPLWLSTGEGEMLEASSLSLNAPAHYPMAAEPQEGYCRLPVMAEASAGHGREVIPEVLSYVDVLESYVRRQLGANPRTIKVLTARGSSMTGQIEDGDIMFVEPTAEFTDDGIYILTLDHLVRVKRLSVSALSQQVIIESNDGRKAEELPLKDVRHRLHIQGRVIGAWSLRRFS